MTHELAGDFVKDIVGYSDKISVQPGESLGFKLSSHRPGPAYADLVRLVSGDDRPHGTGLIEEVVDADFEHEFAVPFQPLQPGSYGLVEDMPEVTDGEFRLYFYPTLPTQAWSTLVDCSGLNIGCSSSGVRIVTPGDESILDFALQPRRWYHLTFRIGVAPVVEITRHALGIGEVDQTFKSQLSHPVEIKAGDWVFAATRAGVDHFNGRLERPEVFKSGELLAGWDFSVAIDTQDIRGFGPLARSGRLFQTPTRAVRGHAWDGTQQSYRAAPDQYGAIHFHEDDLTDAGWLDTVRVTLPTALPSGQYALKVTQKASNGESEDYVPFFVRAPRDAQARHTKLAYLAPTASYLAYANQRLALKGTGDFGDGRVRYANDAYLLAHEEVGNSLYEYHRDGSGVHFSSRLRPILNMKPKVGTWAFNADTHITAWLDAIDQPFEVITDEDLHLEGAQALQGYRCVITGTHPEYYSTAMREGLERWLGEGNRLMYMGGNGFYWRIAYQPDNPAIIEVRRAEDGTRAWIAEAGEYYHQFTGEYGGLWRRLGKPPNQLVGIGFAAQGFDGGTYYRVQPGVLDPRVDFITKGLEAFAQAEAGDNWGAFGSQGGGAAGEEIDRYDVQLGSPEHAVVIASSEAHKPGMLRVKEEFHMMEVPRGDPQVRADMVFFELPSGGAVFSTGSISYAGSLAYNDYRNEIALITGNVVARFLEETPFHLPS